MVFIYVLLLENDKYYIGKTNNPLFRFEQHITNNNGSSWTEKFKPLTIFELVPNCDDFDEDKYTIKYMSKYGIENVRGGSFCQIILDSNTVDNIKKMINNSQNKCFFCNQDGHFANNCPNKKNTYSDKKKVITCYKCKKTGHYANNCDLNYNNCDLDYDIITKNKKHIYHSIKAKNCKKRVGWDSNLNFDIGYYVIEDVVFEYENNTNYFKIKHPTANLYLTENLQTCNSDKEACLFIIENVGANDSDNYCFIKFANSNCYLQADNTWLGHYLKKSNNNGDWEKFLIL